ncbi:MAG: tail fiber domain-containing protein [Candidatus Moraniibacteriota bacterium]
MGFITEIIQNISPFVEQVSSTLKTAITRLWVLLAGDFFALFLTLFLSSILLLFLTISTVKLWKNYHLKLKALFQVSTLASIAILLLAFFSYNLPQKYQLTNLTHNPTKVAGETQANQESMKLTPTNLTNQFIQIKGNLGNLGQIIQKKGNFYLAERIIEEGNIKRHTIKKINLDSGSVDSRIIQDNSIASQDLKHNITIENLTIDDEFIAPELSTNQINFATNSITDQNLEGSWNFNGGTITNVQGSISLWTNDSNYLTSYTESDPIYSAWNKSDDIEITESQITDLQNYITDGNTNWNNEYSFITNLTSFTTDNLTQGSTNKYSPWTVNGTNLSYANNIGIGTTTPNSKLEVTGDIRISSGSGGQIIFADGSTMSSSGLGSAAALSSATDAIVTGDSDSNSSGDIILKTGSNDRLHILNNGNIGIGTTNPGTKLEVNGVITATGGTSTNWNTAYGWGNHSLQGYLTSYSETDPNISAWARNATKPTYTASEVGLGNVPNLTFSGSNTGDNATNSLYASLVTMTYPTSGIALSTGSAWGTSVTNNSTNWNTAYSWGNYASASTYIGTTAISLSRASLAQALTGITSIDGSAGTLTTPRTIAGVSFDGSANITIASTNLSDTTNIARLDAANTFTSTGITSFGGNVGIGTGSPQGQLSLRNTPTAQNPITYSITNQNVLNGYYNLNSEGILYTRYFDIASVGQPDGVYGDSAIRFLTNPITNGSSATEKMRITGAGNVGIGTTNPTEKLTLGGGGNMRLEQSIGGTGAYGAILAFNLLAPTNPATAIRFVRDVATYGNDGAILFDTTNSERMRITSLGNVGIGTTSPGYKLEVNGNTKMGVVYFNNSATQYLGGSRNNDPGLTSTGAQWMRISSGAGISLWGDGGGISNDNPNMRIDTTGNVGIGTTNPTYKLYVSGSAYATGTWSSSDQRWKNNITSLGNNILDKVLALNPVTYTWDIANYPNQGFEEGTQLGFIAQEVENIFPQLVSTDSNGYKSLTYEKLTPLLTKAIQQQQTQITGITNNQNKIVNQLASSANELSDQNLSIDGKIALIGQTLDSMQTQIIASLQDQIDTQKSDITTLQEQMADIEANMYIERYDELWSFYQNFELGKVPLKNALENVFQGKIVAADIEAFNTIKAKDIEATDSLKGKNIELSSDVSGTSIIKAGDLESAKILTTEAKAGMKLYITPMSNTFDQVLYVNGIENGEAFKVKINKEVTEDIDFNWLIVK